MSKELPGLKLFRKIKRPTRMLSGVSVVAVMSKPYPCPHGRCIYCPGGVSQGTPQSYVEDSPAVKRALLFNYHPYRQVNARLRQYIGMGHYPSKIELIVMGGTFPAMPRNYQEWFVAMSLEAMNRFPEEEPPNEISLEEAQIRNEKAKVRCVGLTLETRPDWSKEKHVDWFLHLGATRVELGVQTVYDDILEKVKRGHTVRDSIEATRILKDAGYKVTYHMMLALPGSDPDRDYQAFREIYENPDYRPDYLKIYPTIVVPGTELYKWWKEGKYQPYDDETLIELIAKVKALTPPYVRIIRVQRDVPSNWVAAGYKKTNLREVVWKYMKEHGMKCRCIRCREAGRYVLRTGEIPDPRDMKMMRRDYEASGGHEVFLSFEDAVRDLIYGFLRLRVPSERAHRWEVDNKTAIVRELHVYGPATPVGEEGEWWQHKGLGSKLLAEAEKIAAEEFDAKKILVISGIGAREYYFKRGYSRLKGSFYVVKYL